MFLIHYGHIKGYQGALQEKFKRKKVINIILNKFTYEENNKNQFTYCGKLIFCEFSQNIVTTTETVCLRY